MNILHVDSEISWRGGQNQVLLLVDALGRQNCQQYLACSRDSIIAERWVLQNGTQPCFITFSWGSLIRSAYLLIKFCRIHEIDVIDAHSSKAHTLCEFVKLFVPHVKVCIHRRVDNWPKAFSRFWKYRNSRADCFIAISKAIGKQLERAGVATEKICYASSGTQPPMLGTGIDGDSARGSKSSSYLADGIGEALFAKKYAARLEVLTELGMDSDSEALIFCCAGYFSHQKGYPDLMRALQIYDQKNDQPWICLIAGEGPLMQEIKDLARSLGISHKIMFLGFRKDISKLLWATDIYIMLSRNEGLGTIFVDAAMHGCLLIGTKVGGIPEIIADGTSGVLINRNAPQEVADKLSQFSGQSTLIGPIYKRSNIAAILKYSYDNVIKNYSAESMARKNFEIYTHLLKGKNS